MSWVIDLQKQATTAGQGTRGHEASLPQIWSYCRHVQLRSAAPACLLVRCTQ